MYSVPQVKCWDDGGSSLRIPLNIGSENDKRGIGIWPLGYSSIDEPTSYWIYRGSNRFSYWIYRGEVEHGYHSHYSFFL